MSFPIASIVMVFPAILRIFSNSGIAVIYSFLYFIFGNRDVLRSSAPQITAIIPIRKMSIKL